MSKKSLMVILKQGKAMWISVANGQKGKLFGLEENAWPATFHNQQQHWGEKTN